MKTIEELKSEANARWTGFTIRTKVKIRKAYEWTVTHKEEVAFIATTSVAAIGAVGKIIRTIDRKIDLKREKDLKDLYVYDRSRGRYHKLRHKMTTSEAIEYDRRRSEGETVTQILSSMNLIK